MVAVEDKEEDADMLGTTDFNLPPSPLLLPLPLPLLPPPPPLLLPPLLEG